jgi:adenosylcobinamide-phosphate synthase
MIRRLITLLLALLLDLVFGDPPNQFHPVVLMGAWLNGGRRLAPPRQRFWFGTGWVTAGLALFALPWQPLESAKPSSLGYFVSAFLLKSVFAYRNLRRNVAEVGQALTAGNLPLARWLVGWHLVSRNTEQLTETEVAGAAIESLAENLNDSLVAPLLAYILGGLPAAWAYRFANTADAMWGYRNEAFEQLGKYPARLDDLLNWLPARLTGWLFVAAAWLAGESAGQARRVMLSQHRRTPSPNAGWPMSAMAGALGITLTKRGVYSLEGGQGRVGGSAIRRALRLADLAAMLSVILVVLIAAIAQRK